MFPSGTDYALESGAVCGCRDAAACPDKIRVALWGKKCIYLSRSFSGWTEHFQLIPVEGCPTVFQTICSLQPGFIRFVLVTALYKPVVEAGSKRVQGAVKSLFSVAQILSNIQLGRPCTFMALFVGH